MVDWRGRDAMCAMPPRGSRVALRVSAETLRRHVSMSSSRDSEDMTDRRPPTGVPRTSAATSRSETIYRRPATGACSPSPVVVCAAQDCAETTDRRPASGVSRRRFAKSRGRRAARRPGRAGAGRFVPAIRACCGRRGRHDGRAAATVERARWRACSPARDTVALRPIPSPSSTHPFSPFSQPSENTRQPARRCAAVAAAARKAPILARDHRSPSGEQGSGGSGAGASSRASSSRERGAGAVRDGDGRRAAHTARRAVAHTGCVRIDAERCSADSR